MTTREAMFYDDCLASIRQSIKIIEALLNKEPSK